ncbi:glycosyltransferase [Methylomonas sp. MO1]|uniref:glycosyltransferase family protein n=1 Tax=unclassified Methylomonas TaxID=2608980 RepID=UPI000478AA30|nr:MULTISPECIES: glycosyltransferase [unclassified Methylomonas]MDT4291426.1 glycosyltransferase [Methylomonas sp. MO1]
MNQHKPRLLLYCQHSLGMGHWVRAMTLANALSREFRVTFLNGGRAPDHQAAVTDLDMLNLPPLGMGEDHQLYSQDERYNVNEALAMRRQLILDTYALLRPEVVLIELFPFGRKKLASELLPLLKAARRDKYARPLVLCSLRDIMVNARKDQSRHDERARWITDRYFDGLLVHADPRFARLEDSFKPRHPLKTPLLYTGFVGPRRTTTAIKPPRLGVLVSAGGGMVGASLFQAAVQAHAVNWASERLPMTIVAGPFLPEADWQALSVQVEGRKGLTLLRSVPAMQPLLEAHSVSVSQCGYNTVMDILESRTPALVVPFLRGQEDEQTQRAEKLAQLGLVKVMNPAELTGQHLAEEILQLRDFSPNPAGLDLAGADNTVCLIQQLLGGKSDSSGQSLVQECAHAC